MYFSSSEYIDLHLQLNEIIQNYNKNTTNLQFL